MNSLHFCEECEVEFKIKHEADAEIFSVKHCPFCGTDLNVEDQYEIDEEEE